MSSTEQSDYDKETLTTREDLEDHVLSSNDDEHRAEDANERRPSSARRKSSQASRGSHAQANAGPDVDMEKDGGKTTTTDGEPQDPNVVSWDGLDDPEDPLNWSNALKVVNVGLVSGICLVTPLASCMWQHNLTAPHLLISFLAMFAPGVPNLMAEFGSTNIELGTFVVSIYVLGFASGPMVLAPLSELYGRMPIVSISSTPTEQSSLTRASIMYAM